MIINKSGLTIRLAVANLKAREEGNPGSTAYQYHEWRIQLPSVTEWWIQGKFLG